MLSYDFKTTPEIIWAILIAVGTEIMQVLQATDPSIVTDWRSWVVSLIAAAIRPVLGGILDMVKGGS